MARLLSCAGAVVILLHLPPPPTDPRTHTCNTFAFLDATPDEDVDDEGKNE